MEIGEFLTAYKDLCIQSVCDFILLWLDYPVEFFVCWSILVGSFCLWRKFDR